MLPGRRATSRYGGGGSGVGRGKTAGVEFGVLDDVVGKSRKEIGDVKGFDHRHIVDQDQVLVGRTSRM
jgi:hypothetical protein